MSPVETIQKLGGNSYIQVGLVVALGVGLVGLGRYSGSIDNQFTSLRRDLAQIQASLADIQENQTNTWTVTQMQVWAESLRQANQKTYPDLRVPDPSQIPPLP